MRGALNTTHKVSLSICVVVAGCVAQDRTNEIAQTIQQSPTPMGYVAPQGPLSGPSLRGFVGPVGEPHLPIAPGDRPYEFYFTRAAYSSGGWGRRGGGSWRTDFPEADYFFLQGLLRMTIVDAYNSYNVVELHDPELRKYPFVYTVEVGRGMSLTEPEVEGLRSYLLAGGFWVVDDFWGTSEWANFERQVRRVLPDYSIVDVPLEHPIFHSFYNIDSIIQVPNVSRGRYGGPTWEQDGYVPQVRGVFDDHDRLMVLINWNTDLGDAWEWADDPFYPLRYSTYAWQMGINFVIYAMTH